MIDKLYNYLTDDGSGFIFNTMLLELILVIISLLATQKLIIPLYRSYKQTKSLEEVATNQKPHWFYGHTRYFGTRPHERVHNMLKMSSHHPTLYNMWRGPVWSTLQFFHPDLAKAYFSSGAPKDELMYGGLRPWIGDGLLTSKGEKWKRHRVLLTPAFHFSVLKPYLKISNETLKVLIQKWKQKMEKPIEISDDVSMLTLDTMLQCAMSTKTDCQSAQGCHPYVQAIKDVGYASTARLLNPFLMIDWIFRWSKTGRDYYTAVDFLHSYTEKVIYDRRKILEQTPLTQSKPKSGRSTLDFLDILIATKDEHGKGLTEKEIRDEVDTFLFEGHDTTSSGISWAMYNLAKYPEFQEKCREEVEYVCREQEDVEWDDLSRMTYLTMFIKESLRLYPPVFAIARELDRPLTIKSELNNPKEFTIPAGNKIGMHIMLMHRNPTVWENPLEFDPERFTKENSATRHSHAYVPFAAGSRNCIGQNFAMNEMKVALSQILRNFKLYLDEETPEPKMNFRMTLQSEDGVFIKLSPLDA